ncbi:D-2-hydroxyacid dehydrogenase [Geopsychrobacter electrodiphilus]|uniref:D-2-hydroxyacid dehydrogenase n=1 Tax=Geopsychrobacter electrodiphilus TaxID=225196 RepID=UPI00037E5BA8|nr:D-2-hydroxyacid dehydrogenase [Geopsychrobacter electrodiphilus]
MAKIENPEILVLTAADEENLPGLETLAGTANISYARDEASLKAGLLEADILVVTDFRTESLRKVWPKQHHISWLHATSAGVDALMFPELVQSDIQVTNARGVFNRGIAEYVLGAILLFAKDTLNNLRYQREHQWQHRETQLVRDSVALIVGAGSIGREVASLLRCLGMRVLGTDLVAREDEYFDEVRANDELCDLLPQADYVIINAPLTSQTRGLFCRETFARMKSTAPLINVGRGPVVCTEDLVEALKNGVIAGAALDVFETEPLPKDHPLWDLPQVMISAHMSGDFVGWRRALGEQFVENFRRRQAGEGLFNLVEKTAAT